MPWRIKWRPDCQLRTEALDRAADGYRQTRAEAIAANADGLPLRDCLGRIKAMPIIAVALTLAAH